ncbi:NADH-quinone oxidoreductase subunit J [Dyadobacter jejuensis]|uniref:NADH-quinone oxidoreductase subunit J n=1 Tax=Dyadobacter jejuensis TaxID=1082580 RepID=A0A316ARZ1_9BACT|nr:NADH-quinone oxidoreductase subunit J [Dyadobacter jejuensis]PWJ60089.1 NADH-quinone oxidoreductase subunit J [Dyadobacter jejuensis]
MTTAWYITAAITLVSTLMVITRHYPVHALLYLNVSLISLALLFYLMGAHFAALLQIIIYAGAIMVLFIFVIMLLNLGQETATQEKRWLKPKVWIGPCLLALILLVQFTYSLSLSKGETYINNVVEPKAVALSLFQSYMIGVQLAALLLMAAVVGAAHIGRHKRTNVHRFLQHKPDES